MTNEERVGKWYRRLPKWLRFTMTVSWTAITGFSAPFWVPAALVFVLLIWAAEELYKLWQTL